MQFIDGVRRRTSTWTLIFAFTFAIQVYRWSVPDMAIFGFLTLLLAIESSTLVQNWKFDGIRFSQVVGYIFIAALGTYIYISKRQDPGLAAIFVLFAIILLLAVWRKKAQSEKLNKREFAHAIYWSTLAGILGAWEFFALVLSRIAHNDKAFPTISELLLPSLDRPVPKIIFIICWLGFGFYLIEKWDENE